MKYLIILIATLFMTKECNNTNSSTAKPEDDIETVFNVNPLQENMTLKYRAISRGSYFQIIVTSKTVLIQKDRNSKEISKNFKKEDWSKLMSALSIIDLKNILTFKAPTEARLYDGAASAQLKIMKENDSFESHSFDHGKPPKELEALVKEILSLSQNIE